ncbi:type VII secretion protein EssB [Solibacillus merdavium]|uniref:Type VII secretion protein EssB n=1 Tax=Solibacillus merdavium TaxID=2762218 RepID=A0ABR8XJV0_9BACL|nr:type VII secretion protein EssB [Solibacillus merdavium]MBD8032206.1 type VII secretion protein EssB [Solibacillus merdavium]
MSKKKLSYLEKQLEAILKFEQDEITITFQKEKIKLANEIEIALLQEHNPFINKSITLTDDELIFTYKKESNYMTFGELRKLKELSRWMFASQVLKVQSRHSFNRLHLIVCPENVLIDESLMPYFLHYGVKESIPPYEKDSNRIWNETKALIAAAIDPKYTFEQYIQFSQSIELSPIAEKVMSAKDENELNDTIKKQIILLKNEEKKLVTVSKTKWSWVRYGIAGLLFALIPLGAYTGYSALVLQPRQEAFVEVQNSYLQGDYSEVINRLTNYDIEHMPKVIQYELSLAYIVNETLTEEQKENVLKTITLQTDPNYFKYWIYIGRGQAEEALALARQLEDLDLIMLALLHYEETVKGNLDLESEEREQLLDKIQTEKEEVTEQLEQLKEELEIEEASSSNKDSTKNEEIKSEKPSTNKPTAEENKEDNAGSTDAESADNSTEE